MKILLVEDNVSLCRNIASVLQNEGYTVVTCSNGNEAEFQMLNNSSDLILLDRMLPGKDGITLTREARTAGITVPILLLTALDTLGDKVTGLDAGADDYIVKPFEIIELLARVEAVLRRNHKINSLLEAGDISIDLRSRVVKKGEEEILLTKKEFDILVLLVQNSGAALYRETIYERVWGGDYMGNSRTVDLHVQRLRKKCGLEEKIVAVHKVGYRLEL